SGGAITVDTVPNENFGQLLVTGNTNLTLQTTGGNKTLSIMGATGADLLVSSGSALNANSIVSIGFQLSNGTTGDISGSMAFTNGAHRLIAGTGAVVTFHSGAVFTARPGFTGNPFGNGANANGIVFASGSTFIQQAGSDPFGHPTPIS